MTLLSLALLTVVPFPSLVHEKLEKKSFFAINYLLFTAFMPPAKTALFASSRRVQDGRNVIKYTLEAQL